MAAGRSALILAVDEYEDAKLRKLRAPAQDAKALKRVLGDSEIGNFEVELCANEPVDRIRRKIARFFANRRRDDLLLLHMACHGLKDDYGRLYFAATDTEIEHLGASAVSAEFVNQEMTNSRSRRIVLLLDCCYSGAFASGMTSRAGEGIEVRERFEGSGRAVLTASSAMEYAFEGDELSGEGNPSVFTSAVVKALETGEADRDGDGRISIDELYDYVYDQVQEVTPKQTPSKWIFDVRGDLLVAKSSYVATRQPAELPAALMGALESPLPELRLGAVQVLGKLVAGRDACLAKTALAALESLAEDDSRSVARAATRFLRPAAPIDVTSQEPDDGEREGTAEQTPGSAEAASGTTEAASGPVETQEAPADTANPRSPASLEEPTAPAEQPTPATQPQPADLDAASASESAGTAERPETAEPFETAESFETAEYSEMAEPPGTAEPPDTAEHPDTAEPSEIAEPPGTAEPPDTAVPSEIAEPPETAEAPAEREHATAVRKRAPRRPRRRLVLILAVATAVAGAAAIVLVALDGGDGGQREPQLPTIRVGDFPTAIDARAGKIWVLNEGAGTVTHIDPSTSSTVGEPIPATETATGESVGEPDGLAAGEGAVWLTNGGEFTDDPYDVTRIDPARDEIVGSPIALPPGAPLGFPAIAVGEGGVWVQVDDEAGKRAHVVFIDPERRRVLGDPIPVGGEAWAIAAGEGAVWVTKNLDGTVLRIDPKSRKVEKRIRVEGAPHEIAVGEGNVWVVVGGEDEESTSLVRIDPARNRVTGKPIRVGHFVDAVAVGKGAVWVAHEVDDVVSRIDPTRGRVVRRFRVDSPRDLVVSGDSVWVTNNDNNTVSRIDL